MVSEIRLSKLSDEMVTATIVRWLKHVGEVVTEGEVIAEIETEKAGVDLEATASGVLASILVPEGSEEVPVGTVLATIAAADNDKPAELPPSTVGLSELEEPLRPPIRQSATNTGVSALDTTSVFENRRTATEAKAGQSIVSTPLASMMAELVGLEISSISAGKDGALTRRHVEEALGLSGRAAKPSQTRHQQDAGDGLAAGTVPQNAIRKLTAARMAEAKRTIPHFYLAVECDVAQATNLLERLNRDGKQVRLTLTALIIKTAAVALQRVPALNAEFTPAHLMMREVNIAVAVATPAGLVAPVIKNVNEKMLLRIAEELGGLVERAKNSRLRLEDTVGGTFTVSNLGMFGVTSVVPIITPGQSGVLGIGASRDSPVVRDGAVVVGKIMTVTLSGDHRVLDGAQGAEFLQVFKEFIEEPARMIL